VNATIAGRQYRLACEDGQEDHLLALAKDLDGRIEELRKKFGEKQSMGYFGDGRISLMVGTHTHCPTADHRIMPWRTAFVSDVGMTGDFESVIGMTKDEPLNRFLRKVPGGKFEPATGAATLCAIAVETDDASGRIDHSDPIRHQHAGHERP
jgi:calcineurin-like phosphoesterase